MGARQFVHIFSNGHKLARREVLDSILLWPDCKIDSSYTTFAERDSRYEEVDVKTFSNSPLKEARSFLEADIPIQITASSGVFQIRVDFICPVIPEYLRVSYAMSQFRRLEESQPGEFLKFLKSIFVASKGCCAIFTDEEDYHMEQQVVLEGQTMYLDIIRSPNIPVMVEKIWLKNSDCVQFINAEELPAQIELIRA